MPTQRTGGVKCVCLNCGIEFGVYPSVILQGGGKFCNKQCKDKYLKGENNPFFGKHHTEETKEFYRKNNSGENNANFGKPRSRITKAKISKTKKKNHPYKGKHLPKEWRDNMSTAQKNATHNFWLGKQQPVGMRMKKVEAMVGGFWYGNIRYYDGVLLYCEKFNGGLKERTRALWGYRCVKCGIHESDYLTKRGKPRKLAVHHVHYNKSTCCDGSPRDLVPLCNNCNVEVNYDREYWEKFFVDIIYNKNPISPGKCFYTPEEWLEIVRKDD